MISGRQRTRLKWPMLKRAYEKRRKHRTGERSCEVTPSFNIKNTKWTIKFVQFHRYEILTEHLKLWKVCAKIVPKYLTIGQNDNRVNKCFDLLDRIISEQDVFSQVSTGEYDSNRKRQSEEWYTSASPRPKQARMSKWKFKSFLICYLDRWGFLQK